MGLYLPDEQMLRRYRAKAIDLPLRKVLITNFRGTSQEADLSLPPNCGGYGRVRHFHRQKCDDNWPKNPLPIDPALRALNKASANEIRAQVFQFAACSWRCWYCFVPYSSLDANLANAAYLSAAEMIDLWSAEPNRPEIIDLTGGGPEIAPEWPIWMMEELQQRGLADKVYLWSDDSLSNDLLWTELSDAQRDYLANYPMYGRVCCLKGFDEYSFAFNTRVNPETFDLQFQRLVRLVKLRLDLYVYVTFTTDNTFNLRSKVQRFLDRLQAIHPNLPLRVVPLHIDVFSPTKLRLSPNRLNALDVQRSVAQEWSRGLVDRFDVSLRQLPIHQVDIRSAR